MAGGYGSKSWQAYVQFLEWVLLDSLKWVKVSGVRFQVSEKPWRKIKEFRDSGIEELKD
jgi:hypothetical protein